jgi:hypothetical protein
MRKTITLFFAAVVAMAILVPAAAQGSTASQRAAAKADRNHDRIPDRWERRNGLSLRVKQTKRDQDRDGLNNLGEFKAGTNPRDRDTDNDGMRDGAEHRVGDNPRDRDSDDDGVADGHENAGTVESFTNGVLTIRLASGGTVSGKVVDGSTQIECKTAPTTTPTATASRENESGDDNGGDNRGSGNSGDDNGDDHSGPGRGDDDPGDDDHGDRGDDGNEVACATTDLTAGTVVHEASLNVTDAGAVFREVELVK